MYIYGRLYTYMPMDPYKGAWMYLSRVENVKHENKHRRVYVGMHECEKEYEKKD